MEHSGSLNFIIFFQPWWDNHSKFGTFGKTELIFVFNHCKAILLVRFSPFQSFSVGLFWVFSPTFFATNVDAPPYSLLKHEPTVILFTYLIMCNRCFNNREKCRRKKTYCLKKSSAWKSDENKDFSESSGKSKIAVREFGNGLFWVREFGKIKKIVQEFGNRPPWGAPQSRIKR